MQDDVRRKLLKSMGALGAGLAAPSFFVRNAWAASFRNDPGNSRTVTLGFNVPQSGPYADEGNDELKAFKLAVKHLNGEGDGGLMKTFKPSSLKGTGILGKKVVYVTGDTQTKADAARASAQRMIERACAIGMQRVITGVCVVDANDLTTISFTVTSQITRVDTSTSCPIHTSYPHTVSTVCLSRWCSKVTRNKSCSRRNSCSNNTFSRHLKYTVTVPINEHSKTLRECVT